MPHVPEAVTHLPLFPRLRWNCVEVRLAHEEQRAHDTDERARVHEEARADSDRHDEDAGHRRPHDAGGVDDHAVQRHRVHEVVGPHHLEDEGLPRGVVGAVDEAECARQRVHHPQPHRAGDGQHSEHKRLYRRQRLRDHEKSPFPHAICKHSSERSEEEDGQELERGDQTERGTAPGEAQDQPRLADRLHPRSRQRHALAPEVQPVVAVA